MAGQLVIEAVAGTSPNWELTVESSVGAYAEDHILAALDGTPGAAGIYRVSSVPDSDTVMVVDDLETPACGRPNTGDASFYTPTQALGLSQVPYEGRYWDEAHRRDCLVVDREVGRASLSLTDPTNVTAAMLNVYRRFIITATTIFSPATVTGMGSGPFDLSSSLTWGLRVLTEEGTYDLPIDSGAFLDPSSVPVSDLVSELNDARLGVGADTKIQFYVSGLHVRVARLLDGIPPYVQVNAYPGPASDLNSVILCDTSVHHGTAGVSFAIPAPQDVSRVGLEVVVVNAKASLGFIRYTVQGQTGTVELVVNSKLSYCWDGAAWV